MTEDALRDAGEEKLYLFDIKKIMRDGYKGGSAQGWFIINLRFIFEPTVHILSFSAVA